MSTKYLIFTQGDFAHRKNKPDGYICYRTVLSHALLNKIQLSSPDEAKIAFQDFKKAFEGGSEFNDDAFVLFYPVQMSKKTGFLLIDKSEGYYPLVIYPLPKVSAASRKDALENALDDLSHNIDALLQKLVNSKGWTPNLQLDLQNNIFHYYEDKSQLPKAA